MEIAHTTLQISWRIEPNPAGGFIARCSDATVPPLQGATQAELQQQIREKINAQLATQFPGLTLPGGDSEKTAFSLETNFNGTSLPAGASSQTSDSGVKPAIENWVAKNIAAIVEGKLPPELAQQLKAQAHDGKLQFSVTTTTKIGQQTKLSAKVMSASAEKLPLAPGPQDQVISNVLPSAAPVSASFSTAQLDTGSPIIPSSNNHWFFRLLLAALVLFGLFFLFTHLKK